METDGNSAIMMGCIIQAQEIFKEKYLKLKPFQTDVLIVAVALFNEAVKLPAPQNDTTSKWKYWSNELDASLGYDNCEYPAPKDPTKCDMCGEPNSECMTDTVCPACYKDINGYRNCENCGSETQNEILCDDCLDAEYDRDEADICPDCGHCLCRCEAETIVDPTPDADERSKIAEEQAESRPLITQGQIQRLAMDYMLQECNRGNINSKEEADAAKKDMIRELKTCLNAICLKRDFILEEIREL
jgi:hypothetical protein